MHQRQPDYYLKLPERLYRVTLQSSDGTFPASGRGGGTFSTLAGALRRLRSLEEQGYKARLFVTQSFWQELDAHALEEATDNGL